MGPLSFFLLLFPFKVQGYSYLVRSNEEICVSDDFQSALVPIYKLGGISGVKSEELKIGENDCVLGFQNGNCEEWSLSGFKEKSNLDPQEKFGNDKFEPILDPRWNNLPQIVSNQESDYHKLLNIGQRNRNLKFHLSILAKSAQIILTRDDQNVWDKPRFVFILETFDHSTKSLSSSIEFCYKPHNDQPQLLCATITTKVGEILARGRKWVHLTFFLDKQKNVLELRKKGLVILKADIPFESQTFFNAVNNVFLASEQGVFKLHQYSYLKPDNLTNLNEISTLINLQRDENICVEIVYTQGHGTNTAQFEILYGNRRFSLNSKLPVLSAEKLWHWQIHKENLFLGAGNYKISLNVSGPSVYLREISFCSSSQKTHQIVQISQDMIGCQSLKSQEVILTPSARYHQVLRGGIPEGKDEDFAKICRQAGKADCQNVQEFCDERGCFCLPGNAWDEAQKKCFTKVTMFRVAPEFTGKGLTWLQVNVTKALNSLSEEEKTLFENAKLQISKAYLPSKQNVQEVSFTLNNLTQVHRFENLEENTEYAIRLVFVEKGGKISPKEPPTLKIKTSACTMPNSQGMSQKDENLTVSFRTKNCKANDHSTIWLDLTADRAFRQNPDEKDQCPILDFSVISENGTLLYRRGNMNQKSLCALENEHKKLVFAFQDSHGTTKIEYSKKSEDFRLKYDFSLEWLVVVYSFGIALVNAAMMTSICILCIFQMKTEKQIYKLSKGNGFQDQDQETAL